MGVTRRSVAGLVVVVLGGIATAQMAVSAQGRSPAPAKKWLTYEQVFESAGRGAPGDMTRDPAGILADLPAITGWAGRGALPRDAGRPRRPAAQAVSRERRRRLGRRPPTTRPKPMACRRGFDLRTATATSEDRNVFVFSRNDDLYAYSLPGKRWRQLTATPASPEEFPRISPDGRKVAYTRANNLYVYDLEAGLERQLTSDGSDVIRNGDPSWVYMEEILGRGGNAFWWSPDSSRLAFMRFDDTPVPIFPIYHADGQHGELETQRYPKAGDANPWVKMGVVRVDNGKTAWMDFEEKADHYIAWPFWSPDSRTLTVQWMNRGQDTLRLFACNPDTGKKTLLVEEKQAAWVEWYKDLTFLPSGAGFVLISDVDRAGSRSTSTAPTAALKKQLTPGGWRVNSIAGVDEKNGWIYFIGRPGKVVGRAADARAARWREPDAGDEGRGRAQACSSRRRRLLHRHGQHA